MSSEALEALVRALDEASEVDNALRSAVRILSDQPGVAWAAIAFLEDGELVLGPQAGKPEESRRARVPVTYEGEVVGELWVDGDAARDLLEQVAELVSAHVLIGWDTRGESWEP